MPPCYVPVCLKKKHNARKVVWFTKATVHWSNFCIFVDSIDSQIILRMIYESKHNFFYLLSGKLQLDETSIDALYPGEELELFFPEHSHAHFKHC